MILIVQKLFPGVVVAAIKKSYQVFDFSVIP